MICIIGMGTFTTVTIVVSTTIMEYPIITHGGTTTHTNQLLIIMSIPTFIYNVIMDIMFMDTGEKSLIIKNHKTLNHKMF
jgi:hypothetical protein